MSRAVRRAISRPSPELPRRSVRPPAGNPGPASTTTSSTVAAPAVTSTSKEVPSGVCAKTLSTRTSTRSVSAARSSGTKAAAPRAGPPRADGAGRRRAADQKTSRRGRPPSRSLAPWAAGPVDGRRASARWSRWRVGDGDVLLSRSPQSGSVDSVGVESQRGDRRAQPVGQVTDASRSAASRTRMRSARTFSERASAWATSVPRTSARALSSPARSR